MCASLLKLGRIECLLLALNWGILAKLTANVQQNIKKSVFLTLKSKLFKWDILQSLIRVHILIYCFDWKTGRLKKRNMRIITTVFVEYSET